MASIAEDDLEYLLKSLQASFSIKQDTSSSSSCKQELVKFLKSFHHFSIKKNVEILFVDIPNIGMITSEQVL